MGLLLSHTHLHGENNSPQSAVYTDHIIIMYAYVINQQAPSNFAKKCLLKLIKLFSGHYTYVATQYQNYPKRWHTASSRSKIKVTFPQIRVQVTMIQINEQH